MTTTTTGPWGPDYVPVALRPRRVTPTVSVDEAAQRREQEREQRPVRPAAPTRRRRARSAIRRVTYAFRRAVERLIAWLVGLVKLLAAVAVIGALAFGVTEYGPTTWHEFIALGTAESSAVKVTESGACAAADALEPLARLANGVDRTNEAMRMNGILDEIGPVETGTSELGKAVGLDECDG
jgi:hypothetical protein